jgi:serine/threonine protein kinase
VSFLVLILASLQAAERNVGSLTHAAPELLASNSSNTPQSDVYAFGILMYELITGKEPFKGCSPTDLIVIKTTKPTASTLTMEPAMDPVYNALYDVRPPCPRACFSCSVWVSNILQGGQVRGLDCFGMFWRRPAK